MLPRAFVAVDPEPVDRHALHQLQRQLGSDTSRGWLAAEDLHLTLRFLGDLDDARSDDVAGQCAALAARTAASLAAPVAIEAWPPQRAQVLVLGVAVQAPLGALHEALRQLPSTPMRDSGPWRPHITLRRAPMDVAPARPSGPLLPAPIACQRITLFARADANASARYRRVASWPLRGSAGSAC